MEAPNDYFFVYRNCVHESQMFWMFYVIIIWSVKPKSKVKKMLKNERKKNALKNKILYSDFHKKGKYTFVWYTFLNP